MVSPSGAVAAWDSVGQTLAVLAVMVAVVVAVLRWELPGEREFRQRLVDQAIQQGISGLRTKPTVKNRIRVVKSFGDNSNSSYAALGIRATGAPADAPSWMHRSVRRLESVNRSLTSSLKELARKSILGPV